MAAPNILNVSNITGKTAVDDITTTLTSLVSNTINSNKIYKLNALIIANIDGTTAATVDIAIYRTSRDAVFYIAKTVSVPADSTIEALSRSVYLEEGDELRIAASTNGDLQAVCSYEEIS